MDLDLEHNFPAFDWNICSYSCDRYVAIGSVWRELSLVLHVAAPILTKAAVLRTLEYFVSNSASEQHDATVEMATGDRASTNNERCFHQHFREREAWFPIGDRLRT